MSGSAAIVLRVGGQPLRYERVDGGAARAVAGDGGQELFPAERQGTQRVATPRNPAASAIAATGQVTDLSY